MLFQMIFRGFLIWMASSLPGRLLFRKFTSLSLISPQVNPQAQMVYTDFYHFFTNYWRVLFFCNQFFFSNFVLPSSGGKTFITLVPRKENPILVSNYCLISLCNVCFKIDSKILTSRLKIVLPHLIGKEQAIFVFYRSTFDNIIAMTP